MVANTLFSPLRTLLVLTPVQIFAGSALFVPFVLLSTWLYTTILFRNAVKSADEGYASTTTPKSPPHLPYIIPWLGSAVSFLDETPGRFWNDLRSRLGRSHEACTILLGGMPTYVLAGGAEGLFRHSKSTDRDRFDKEVLVKGFGMSAEDFVKFRATVHAPAADGKGKMDAQEALYHEYLLAPKQVNILTRKFIETFQTELGKLDVSSPLDLITTVRDLMFHASTTAFMGSKVLELCPNWASDFFTFDAGMLKLFYSLPHFLSRKPYDALQRLLSAGERWHAEAHKHFNPADIATVDWDPWLGCRFLRARQVLFAQSGITARGQVSPDIGFLFGLASNAIPAATWMLAHILTSRDETLLPQLMDELRSTQNTGSEGTDIDIDVSRLVQLPLLSSIYMETLRLYVDVLVTRTVNQTFTVQPTGRANPQSYLLEKGNIVMAPSYLSHHDPVFWPKYNASSTPVPANEFHPRRFLVPTLTTTTTSPSGNTKFSTTGTADKLFPYGGGPHMCPGRVFAKQEILAAVAVVLLTFEIELSLKGQSMPGRKRVFCGTGVVAMEGVWWLA